MDNTLDAKKEQVMKMLNNEVSKYTKDGSSLPQAITLTCKKLGLNPYNIVSKYFPEIKPDDLNAYKDIKTDEGSFVTLKGDSSQSQYEVININNKDAIVLRNTDNNQEITASEDEITPVITENKMDKLNEAQYSVSINGLETTDAAALSQMLSSAAQAEQSNGAVTDPMSINPEPMDMTTGMPMDMGAELPAPSLDMPMDSTMPEEILPAEDSVEDVPAIEDDIEFDEELPTDETISLDTDANAYANPEMDTAVVPTDSLEDEEDPTVDEMGNDVAVDDESSEPVESPEELEPANDFGGEESIEDMSMDDMMDDGMYEGCDYDALIKEALEAAGLNESEETIPASDEVEDDGSMDGAQEDYAEEITEGKKECCPKCGKEECVCEEDESFDDEIAEALRLAGVELNEADEEKYRRVKKNVNKNFHIYDPAHDEADDGQDYDDDAIEMSVEYIANRDGLPLHVAARKYAKEYNISYEVVCKAIERDGSGPDNPPSWYYDIDHYKDVDAKYDKIDEGNEEINAGDNINLGSENFDDEIAEALRLAGVELNEAEATEPTPVDDKTLYRNKQAKTAEKQEPEYHEVDTTPFSKESSEGFKMTMEAAVNKEKVKKIYETAKSMYAKKDFNEWMTLDRRYVTKLIKEGISYDKANKILTSAKKGK